MDGIYVDHHTYRLDGQFCIEVGVLDLIFQSNVWQHQINKKNFIDKKRVDNTKFKTNLTVQAVDLDETGLKWSAIDETLPLIPEHRNTYLAGV